MHNIDMKPIGRRIAGKRVERGMRQEDLARQADIVIRTINLVEQGKRPGVSLGTLKAIAEVLGVGLDYLVYGEAHRRG